MNTTENNKLILEFMGEPHKVWQDLAYHSDWNWLMEVVEKIENLGSKSAIVNHLGKHIFTVSLNDNIISEDGNTKIEAVYNACVEFIKWYNENK